MLIHHLATSDYESFDADLHQIIESGMLIEGHKPDDVQYSSASTVAGDGPVVVYSALVIWY